MKRDFLTQIGITKKNRKEMINFLKLFWPVILFLMLLF